MVPLDTVEVETFEPEPPVAPASDSGAMRQIMPSRPIPTANPTTSQSPNSVMAAFPRNDAASPEYLSLDDKTPGPEALSETFGCLPYSKEGSDDPITLDRRSPLMQTNDLKTSIDASPSFHSLAEVSSRILGDTSLAHSHIVTFRCYNRVDLGIIHRFIVLELLGDQLTHSWLRFDRRPGWRVPLAKLAASGTLAGDSAVFGSTLLDVLGPGVIKLECHAQLKNIVELQMLVPLFHIFMQTAPRYRFWKENCWFLSSLIAGLLIRLGGGIFEYGALLYPNIAPELRRYMHLRYIVETGMSPESLTEVEQVEYLLIKYRPGKAGRAAVIRLRSGGLVHGDTMNVAAMTISALKARFTNYARRFLYDVLRFQPTPPRKTVQLVRALAAVAGDAFMDDLHSTARSASTEAIVILRDLLPRSSLVEVAKSTPVLNLPQPRNFKEGETGKATSHEDDGLLVALSEAYNSLGDAHKAMLQWNMAERAYESGVRVLRVLSSRNSQEFLKPLSLQLSALAMAQIGMGKLAESVVSRHESIMLRRQICVESARAYGRDLRHVALGPPAPPGITVRSYTEQCVDVCRSLYREARGVHFVDQECIRIRRMLYQDIEPLHREHLARRLLVHAQSLYHIFPTQAKYLNPIPSPAAHCLAVKDVKEPLLELEGLVGALNLQGWTLGALGHYCQAAEALDDSVSVSRVLQSRDPSGVGAQNLPYSLCALGDCLYSSGRPHEALSLIEEAVSLSRQRHMGSPFLANVLASYCRALRAAGRLTDAVAVGTESSDLWEQIVKANPSANHGAKITFNKFALTNTLIRGDDPQRALVVAQQAIEGLSRLVGVNVDVPKKLQDIPTLVRAATENKSLPGSPWVAANLQGELDDLIKGLSSPNWPFVTRRIQT